MVSTVQQNKQNNSYQGTRRTFASGQGQLLAGVAEATRKLLTVANFDAAVNGALEAIATSASIDRIYILENKVDSASQEVVADCPYEWTAKGIVRGSDSPGRFPMSYAVFGDWLDRWQQGDSIQALARELSDTAQALQEKDEALSLLTVPIEINNRLWGVIGFDDCTTERVWSEAEIAVLETAAASFAGALQRRENERSLAKRDRILEATAAASAVLLNGEDFNASVITAFQLLGESLGFDRIAVGQQMDDPTGETSGFIRFLYEWNGQGISAQLSDHEDMADFWWDEMGIHHWYEANLKGEAFGQLIDDLPEPFRNLMASVDVKSTHNIPIFVEGQFWGVFGIDHCRKKKLLGQDDLDALRTAANCVGSAIAQDRMRQDRVAVVEAHNKALAERDRILEATAAAANVMLTEDDFDSAVNKALTIIGKGLDVDRTLLGQYFKEAEYLEFLYEWVAAGTSLQTEHSGLARISDSEIEFALPFLRGGKIVGGVVDELPEPFRSGQMALGVKSTYAVPVFVEGQYWGLICLDDCHKLTRRSEAELEALMTLANCIGSAIEQDRSKKAREAAERERLIAQVTAQERAARAAELEAANEVLSIRDRWLETTAAAASKLLSSSDIEASVQAALQTIGENLECDRLSVLQHVEAPSGHPLGAVQGIYEWDAKGVRAQIEDPDLKLISAEGFEDWFTRFFARQWVGGHVSDLPEPARSGQESLGVLSTYAVPIFIDEQLWGVMAMDYCRQERQLSAAELAVFQTAASCVGSAIYQAEVRRDIAAREQAAELAKTNEVIAQTLANLATNPEPNDFLGRLLLTLCEQTGACKTHLFLYEAATHTLSLHSAVEEGQHYLGSPPGNPAMFSQPFPADISGAWRGILASPQPLSYAELGLPTSPNENFWWPETLSWHLQEGHSQIACARMMTGDAPIGFIGFSFRDRTNHSPTQLEFIQALTNQATLCIQLTRLGEEAKQAAILQEREKAAQTRAAQLTRANQALKTSLDSLAQQPKLDSFLQRVVDEAAVQTGAASGHLFVVDEATNCWVLQVSTDNDGDWRSVPDMDIWQRPIPLNGAAEFWMRILEKQPVVIENLQETLTPGPHIWEPSIAWHLGRNHTNIIAVPLVLGDHVLGFLGLPFIGTTSITQDDVELAQALANQATLAIQLTRLAEEAKQTAILQEREKAARNRAAELAKTNEALSETLTALTATPELNDFLGQNLSKMAEQVGAADSHLFLYHQATHTLSQHITVQNGQVYPGNAPTDPDIFRNPIPADLTRAWEIVVSSSKPFTLDENHPDAIEFFWPESIPWHQARGHTSAVCACMKVGDQPLGFIGFAFTDRTLLTEEQLQFIQALTNQATLSLYLTRLAEEAQTSALSSALTGERNRLAREIHDTLAQAFTGVSLQLEAAKIAIPDSLEDSTYHIDRAGQLARRGLSEARRSVHALRSQALETDTLPNALRTAINEMTQSSPTQAHFRLKGTPYALPENIQTNLLRIGQEAITNALRHAQADNLTLLLEFSPDQIRLSITDDGTGCEISAFSELEGFGLIGMRERVYRFDGHFAFTSNPGKGTVIDITIPTRP